LTLTHKGKCDWHSSDNVLYWLVVAELVDGFVVVGCFVELFESLLVEVVFEDFFALGWCLVCYIDAYLLGHHRSQIVIHRL
jgi:hypothetical protein